MFSQVCAIVTPSMSFPAVSQIPSEHSVQPKIGLILLCRKNCANYIESCVSLLPRESRFPIHFLPMSSLNEFVGPANDSIACLTALKVLLKILKLDNPAFSVDEWTVVTTTRLTHSDFSFPHHGSSAALSQYFPFFSMSPRVEGAPDSTLPDSSFDLLSEAVASSLYTHFGFQCESRYLSKDSQCAFASENLIQSSG